jgi:hypothetical protein
LLGEFDDLSDDIKFSFLSEEEQRKIQKASKALLEYGITAMFSIANGPMTLDYAMENGCELITQIAKNVMRVFVITKSNM